MKNTDDNNKDEKVLESGWAGPGIEIWPEEDDYVMWRSMKKDARRHLECSQLWNAALKVPSQILFH